MTRRRVRLAGLVGLAVLWLLWSGGAPAGARPSGLAHGPVEAATQSAPSLELVRQTTWVHPGEAYTVDVRVTGAPAGATLDLVVHDCSGPAPSSARRSTASWAAPSTPWRRRRSTH